MNQDEANRNLFRKGIASFGYQAPAYHLELTEKGPSFVWDFYSLWSGMHYLLCLELGRGWPYGEIEEQKGKRGRFCELPRHGKWMLEKRSRVN